MVIESIDNIDVAYALSQKYNIEVPIINTAMMLYIINLMQKKLLKN